MDNNYIKEEVARFFPNIDCSDTFEGLDFVTFDLSPSTLKLYLQVKDRIAMGEENSEERWEFKLIDGEFWTKVAMYDSSLSVGLMRFREKLQQVAKDFSSNFEVL